MQAKTKPIPNGYHSITPYLTVDNAKQAIDFYTRAFGAKETMRMDGPPGKISHAELKIGDSILMVSDECLVLALAARDRSVVRRSTSSCTSKMWMPYSTVPKPPVPRWTLPWTTCSGVTDMAN
jgi:hypothetical protein